MNSDLPEFGCRFAIICRPPDIRGAAHSIWPAVSGPCGAYHGLVDDRVAEVAQALDGASGLAVSERLEILESLEAQLRAELDDLAGK